MSTSLNVLLLSHVEPGFANTCFDHQDALSVLSRNRVVVLSPLDHPARAPDLAVFDAVVIHYSIVCFSHDYLPPVYRRALQDFRGLKVIFIQDEYRSVWAANDAMAELGIDVLFTCVPPSVVEPIYGQLSRRGVRIEHTLTGYVPDSLIGGAFRLLADRPLDAVYRGRPLPYTLGRLATEKVEIARRFREIAPAHGLRHDVDWREGSRIYGSSWNDFLASGRCALGTESGASICDFSGEIDRAVRLYMYERPQATYEEAYEDLLAPFEGNVVINTISPRAFEAIALGTALVQFPGEYSGLLEAGRHYVVLEKNFSNMAEVAAAMRDLPLLQGMVRAAYEDVIASGRYSYRTFAAHVDEVIEEEWHRRVHRDPLPLPAYLARVAGKRPQPAAFASVHELQVRVANSLLLPRDDYARADAGARIADDCGFFERPHDADYLLRPEYLGGYAAAVSHELAPQWIEIDLGTVREVWRLRLLWYTDEHYARDFIVEGRADCAQPWTVLAHEQDNGGPAWERAIGGVAVRWLRLSAWRFQGQPRILLRRLQVLGPDPAGEPAGEGRLPTRSNLLQHGGGATVLGSSKSFAAPHDCAALIGEGPSIDAYAAVLESSPLPHWIEIDLGRMQALANASLAWFSADHRCTAFRLLGKGAAEDAWQVLAERTNERDATSVVTLSDARARFVRLEASAFKGQPRLLLRAFYLIGAPVPAKARAAGRLGRLISALQAS